MKCLLTSSVAPRPQHEMYEDMEPLFANPILPLLAIALAYDVFRDYSNSAEIEAIPPPQDGYLHHLRIKKVMLQMPYFGPYLLMDPRKRYFAPNRSVIAQFSWVIVQGTPKTSVYMTLGQRSSSKRMVRITKTENLSSKAC